MKNERNNKNWAAWLMRNYRLTFLVLGMLFILGILGLLEMPKDEFPEFTIRQGMVVGVYPGASTEEVEKQMTRPLERYLFTFKEVKRSKTESISQNGLCLIKVELDESVKDKDAVWNKIKHGLNTFRQSLPKGVMDVIVNDEFGETSALLLAMESDMRSYRELEKYCDDLADRLRRVELVSNVRISGSVKEQISLYIDRDRLSTYGISDQMLGDILSAEGITIPSGSLSGWKSDIPVHVSSTLRNEDEIANKIILSTPAGQIVRVKDIAEIKREYDKSAGYVNHNGHNCVILSMEMQKGGNIIKLGEEVDDVLASFREEIPNDVAIHRITDQPKIVSESITSFLRDLLLSVIVIVVVMMVLFPIRSALVAAISIPISTFISIGLMYILGFPLNLITLAALIVVLGMEVDNSIVVIDGYLEYLNKGMSRWHAAAKSVQQYFMPILLATACITIIFFPLLFTMDGQEGEFLRLFPWTMAINLLVSLLVAVSVIPILEVWLIKPQNKVKSKPTITDYVQKCYDRVLAFTFRHPYITIGGGFALMLTIPMISPYLKTRLMPYSERDQFAVEISLPHGTGLEVTRNVTDSICSILKNDPRVKSITSFVGLSSPRFVSTYAPKPAGKNYAQLIVNTVSNDATAEIVNEYTEPYSEYFPNAYVKFKRMDAMTFDPLEYRFYGEDMDSLYYVADKVMDYLRSRNDLIGVRSNFEDREPILEVSLDPLMAYQIGINKVELANQIFKQSGNLVVSSIWEDDYEIPLVIKEKNYDETDFTQIGDILIKPRGAQSSIPLRQIAREYPDWNNNKIVHRNGLRCITVTADLLPSVASDLVNEETLNYISDNVKLPAGVTMELGGEVEGNGETIPKVAAGLAIAMVLIFLFILFNFKKYSITVVSMLSLTFFLPWALFGLWISNVTLCVTSVFGFITLMGMIMRNEILIFEHAEELRKQGIPVKDAAYEAGKRRMVPIFLTTATTAVGVIPMIIGGSAMWGPVGIIIFAGGVGALIMVVTMLPVIYWKIYDKKRK